MRAHGVVTGIHDYGVFVGFYNDCSGLAPVEELAVEPSQRPSDVYTVGQVGFPLSPKPSDVYTVGQVGLP